MRKSEDSAVDVLEFKRRLKGVQQQLRGLAQALDRLKDPDEEDRMCSGTPGEEDESVRWIWRQRAKGTADAATLCVLARSLADRWMYPEALGAMAEALAQAPSPARYHEVEARLLARFGPDRYRDRRVDKNSR